MPNKFPKYVELWPSGFVPRSIADRCGLASQVRREFVTQLRTHASRNVVIGLSGFLSAFSLEGPDEINRPSGRKCSRVRANSGRLTGAGGSFRWSGFDG